MSPVMALFLFLPPRANDSPETMLGGEIWQQMLSRSIILTEQMRQSSGTVEFAEILDGLRTGNGAKWAKHLDLINSRVLATSWTKFNNLHQLL